MTNSEEENPNQDENTLRTRTSVLDNTPLVESPEGYDGDDWTFRKGLEAEFLALRFKSRKSSHEKEPATRLADSLWLTWHRVSRNHPAEAAVDNIEVRVTFASHETSDSINYETTVNINCYGRGNKSRRPYRVEKMKLVLKNHDTADLFHHIHHFLTKPRSW
jgi:hypothetical protein